MKSLVIVLLTCSRLAVGLYEGDVSKDPKYSSAAVPSANFFGQSHVSQRPKADSPVSIIDCSTPDGGQGTCIDVDAESCYGGLLYDGDCPGPGNIRCCATYWGGCIDNNGNNGNCTVAGVCNNTAVAGLCPGPDSVQCCVGGTPPPPVDSWTTADAAVVMKSWIAHKVRYSWGVNIDQYGDGPGLYRSDCSAFVSACWNVSAPGAVTSTMLGWYAYQIPPGQLRFGDALLNPAEHVALFVGGDATAPQVVEECGHVPECCGSEATCPGACGPSETDCNEYCPGCPIQQHTWPGIPEGFVPVRRYGW